VETFIVRIWTPAPELAREITSPELKGDVEHVRTKARSRFRSTSDLVEILSAVARSADGPGAERFKGT
jgi:hypothetical protein